MAYERQEFVDGTTVLSAEHLDKMQTGIIDNEEQVDNIQGILNATKEYVDVTVESANRYDYTSTPIAYGNYTYRAYVAQGTVSNEWANGSGDIYVNTPPSMVTNCSNVPSSTPWGGCLLPWVKVKKNHTYLIKSNTMVEHSGLNDSIIYYGCINMINFVGVNGQLLWESSAYNSSFVRNKGGVTENGDSTNQYYGTTYAEVIATQSFNDKDTKYCRGAYLVKFNVDGWVKLHIFSSNYSGSASHYGNASDIENVLTEQEFAEIIQGIQITDVTNIKTMNEQLAAPYSAYEADRVETIAEYHSNFDDMTEMFTKFVKEPIYSKNLYNKELCDKTNKYIVQKNNTSQVSLVGVSNNPSTLLSSSVGYGKNLFSGWTKITNKGIYCISQFNQVKPENFNTTQVPYEYGYIGTVLIGTEKQITTPTTTVNAGDLVYMSSNYMNSDTYCTKGSTGNELIKPITGTVSGCKNWKFQKVTDDELWICWFMSQKASNMSGYDFTSSAPAITTDEADVILSGTMLQILDSASDLPQHYEAYSSSPVAFEYLIDGSNIKDYNETISNLQNNVSEMTEASSLSEEITILNSDKIAFFGNSFLDGYTVIGHHPIVHLNGLSDYMYWNYSQSGDDIQETLIRVQKDRTKYGNTTPPSAWNMTYAVIAQQDNDGALHAFNYSTYYENAKHLGRYLASYGATPIYGTEHDSNEFYYNMMRICDEDGYMFMDWGQIASHNRADQFKPLAYSSHPSTRTHWTWTKGMLDFFNTLPKPRKAIKIFKARNDSIDRSGLLYNTINERFKNWISISGGYTSFTPETEKYFDRFTDKQLVCQNTKNEYLSLVEEESIELNKKVLVEVITPYTTKGLEGLDITLDTTATSVYLKRNTSPTTQATISNNIAFGIGENDPSLFVKGATLVASAGQITGNVAGTYTIDDVVGTMVVTTKSSSGIETSGTDILVATVNGNSIANLVGSYKMPNAAYQNTWDKPIGEWQLKTLAKGVLSIPKEDLAYYVDFDKVSILLESDSNIVINEVKATVKGQGEKNRETNFKVKKPIIGESIVKETDFNTHQSNYIINGTVDYPTTASYTDTFSTKYTEAFPYGISSVIHLHKDSSIKRTLTVPINYFEQPTVQVRILARNKPPFIFSDESWETSEVTQNSYPCGLLKVGFANGTETTDCDWFAGINVGLWWNWYIFNIPVQRANPTLFIKSFDDYLEIARVDVDKIDNYATINRY